MDLPPDKAKFLKQYDDEKKWDIICDQVSLLFVICSEPQVEETETNYGATNG